MPSSCSLFFPLKGLDDGVETALGRGTLLPLVAELFEGVDGLVLRPLVGAGRGVPDEDANGKGCECRVVEEEGT